MQHLDDGYLQSWLDRDRSGITEGEAAEVEAHVASCEACAARLAELEETSERSRSLLAAVAPSEKAAPDFGDVVRRSRRRRRAGGRGRRWMAAGWAASIVAAAGLGWLSHGLLGPDGGGPASPPAAANEGTVASADRASTDGEREQAEGEPDAAAADSEAAAADPEPAGSVDRTTDPDTGSAAVVASADSVDPETTVAASADSADPDPETAVAAAPPAESAAMAAGAEADRGDSAAAAADLLDEPRPFLVQGRVRGEDGAPVPGARITVPGTGYGAVTEADGTFSLSLSRDAVTADPAGRLALRAQMLGYEDATQALDPQAANSRSVDFRLEADALRLQELYVSGVPEDDAAARAAAREITAEADGPREVWVPVPRGRAETEAGFTLLTVPDLDILEIEIGEVGGAAAVRVRQELESGATLTLVQRRADRPAVAPVLPEGHTIATAETGELRITAAAPIPADSLRALLERVR